MTQRLLYEYKLPWLSKVGARQEVTTLNKINSVTYKNTIYEKAKWICKYDLKYIDFEHLYNAFEML